MTETVVVGEENNEPTSAEQSAHEAAVAEGATAVQAAQAAQSAEEARAAAEMALEAAESNAKGARAAEEAAAQAAQSAAQAGVSLEMIHEQQKAMASAIEVLAAELRASRRQAGPPAEPRKAAPDRAPARSSRVRWRRA